MNYIMRALIGTAVLMGAILACAPFARADSVNELLSPGQLIQGHAKYESDCSNCHKHFDKAAQTGLCKDCHKDIAKDIDTKHGFHGLMKEGQECRACHTEHKGRNAQISQLDAKNFDHSVTGFILKGGHLKEKVQCKDCHPPAKKYRDAPTKCFSCHEKDDKHKGKYGTECANCHEEKDWKTIHFDHSKSRFPLLGKHVDVKCNACHINGKFKDTPLDCNSCHKKDDKHKGKFGPKCETCHTDRGWKEIIFDHDKKTKYPLLGKHRETKCVSCHKGDLYKEKLPTACISCHKKDDKHKGTFGPKCETCHIERGWKEIVFDHDKKTKYPLLGKHRETKCVSCHKGDLYKEKLKSDCFSCHEKDDKHKGQEGKKCESCHGPDSWKKALFDHRLARFALTGAHVLVECKKCHTTVVFRDAKSDCYSCHEKQDVHKRTLGTGCNTCHNTRDWKDWDFDHDKTHFSLEGKHKNLKCVECHNTPVNQKVTLAVTCVSCHDKDDRHSGDFGPQCERCHVGTSWKTIKQGSERWVKPRQQAPS